MIIDVGIAKYLTYTVGLNWIVAQTISFTFAVTNGFVWNSLWTFRGMGSGKRHEQYLKFLAVNIVGLLLNIGIMKTMFLLFIFLSSGRLVLVHQGNPDPMHWNIAKAIAIVCVSTWNFLANKKWTFRAAPAETADYSISSVSGRE